MLARSAIALLLVLAPAVAGCGGSALEIETKPGSRATPQDPGAGASGGGANCEQESVGLTPINDLGTDTYKGSEGGLYAGGENSAPPGHLEAAEQLAAGIEPLDAEGNPDPNGLYALLSIGMSITQIEFRAFQALAQEDPDIAAPLRLVDGAQSGITGELWADPDHEAWAQLDPILAAAGVRAPQVAAVWLEMVDAHERPDWPAQAEQLQRETEEIVRILHERFPNLRLVYASSVRYNGYVVDGPSPEPIVYESAFGVKWAIEDQIQGDTSLNFDPANGPVAAPWLGWGPYLWADGTSPRSDGLRWVCADLYSDGLHPSEQGARKAAQELLEFFSTDPSARIWFTDQ